MAQEVEHLPSKHKTLNLIPSTKKKKKKKEPHHSSQYYLENFAPSHLHLTLLKEINNQLLIPHFLN
jgi:hypothetical protein